MKANYRNRNSGFVACRKADQLSQPDLDVPNELSIENGLLKLVESFEREQAAGDWIDYSVIKEGTVAYG